MPEDTSPIAPRLDIIPAPILVAGPSAMVGMAPERTDQVYLSRLALRQSGVIQADGTPHPLADTLFRNRRFTPSPDQARLVPEERIEGPSIFGGVVSMHFGHVLTQSLGRLWAHGISPDAPILFLPETLGVTVMPAFFTNLAQAFGLRNPLRLITRPTRCEWLLIPEDICNLKHRPAATPFFLDWLAQRRRAVGAGEAAPSRQPRRLYVSRSRLGPQHGHYLQERLLEEALAANGYEIFHPQEHSMEQQIEAYASAEKLIFADGSAVHLWSLVAQSGQNVALVLRRPRDRALASWFQSLVRVPFHYLDCVIASFWRSGQGPGKTAALLDVQALWDRLRGLGFHDDNRQYGTDRSQSEAWVSSLQGRYRTPLSAPFDLDLVSHEILSIRRQAALRQHPVRVWPTT